MVCFLIQHLWAMEYLVYFGCSTSSKDVVVCRVSIDCVITNTKVLSHSQQTTMTQ